MHKLDSITGAVGGACAALFAAGYVEGVFTGAETIAALIGVGVVLTAIYKGKQ